MPLYGADSFLGWMDNWRRVAARNVKDLVEDPKNALSKTLHASVDTIDETMRDPMNFVGAGVIKPAIVQKAVSTLKPFVTDEVLEALQRSPGYKARNRLVLMTPDDFLSAAEHGQLAEKTAAVAKRFEAGDKLPLDNLPTIYVDRTGKMYGHEGRHRARELKNREVSLIPVELRSENIRFSEQIPGRFDDLGDKYPSELLTERGLKRSFPVPREEANLYNAGVIDPQLEELLLRKGLK